MAVIRTDICTGCCGCIDLCPVLAIELTEDRVVTNPDLCIQCDICITVCPVNAACDETRV